MSGIAALVVSCLLAVEPAAEAPADPGRHKSRIERIIAEGVIGSVTGAGGFLLGALLGGSSSQWALYTGMLGGPVGLTAGLLVTGYLMDGNGSWLATLLAAGGGMIIAYVVVTTPTFLSALAGSPSSSAITTYAGLLLVVGLPTLAAVITYESTSPDSRTRVEREQQALRLFPVIGPSSAGRGVVFGLGGLL